MGGIFVLAALLWVTEALPLFATALLLIGLQIILLANPGGWSGFGFSSGPSPHYRQIVASAADPVLMLFFGGLLLARAAVKEGVDKAMSSLLLRPFGGRPMFVTLGIMLVTAIFSMWMSNTATTAMMMTLVAPMVAQVSAGDPFRKMLVLAVPFAANIGGIGTPISSPPNAIAVSFLNQVGHSISFLEWMLVAVPLMVGLLLIAWQILWRFFRPHQTDLRISAATHRLTPRGWFVVVVFVVTVLLWVTDRWHGLPPAVVALLPIVTFTATGLLDRRDVNSLEWNILILIAGGIALGAGMQLTKLDQKIVSWLPATSAGILPLLLMLVLGTVLFGTFMSNTAAANLILPIGISSASVAGGAPLAVQVAISIALAASMSMALPVSTPPNAIAYGSGEIKTRDMALAGSILGALAVLLIVGLGGAVLRFWGLPR
jgi:sodium-dependent dicarboxylate transporter 2/3/5